MYRQIEGPTGSVGRGDDREAYGGGASRESPIPRDEHQIVERDRGRRGQLHRIRARKAMGLG